MLSRTVYILVDKDGYAFTGVCYPTKRGVIDCVTGYPAFLSETKAQKYRRKVWRQWTRDGHKIVKLEIPRP